jgi:hypothetical protein
VIGRTLQQQHILTASGKWLLQPITYVVRFCWGDSALIKFSFGLARGGNLLELPFGTFVCRDYG